VLENRSAAVRTVLKKIGAEEWKMDVGSRRAGKAGGRAVLRTTGFEVDMELPGLYTGGVRIGRRCSHPPGARIKPII